MFYNFLQIDGLVLLPIIFSVLISIIFFIIIKKSLKNKIKLKDSIEDDIKNLQNRIDNIAGSIGKINEIDSIKDSLQNRIDNIAGSIGKIDEIASMKQDMITLETNITDANNLKNITNYENLEKMINTRLENVSEEIEKITDDKISNDVVVKDEFYELKNRVNKFLGNNDNESYILDLFEIINSDNIKTIQWKCELLNFIKDGYVPEIHSNVIKGNGSVSSRDKFIKLLQDKNIIVSDEVEIHRINDEEYWMFEYTKNPFQLKTQFEKLKIREKEYQKFISKNVELVEPGLKVVKREYQLSTGPIDFLCYDKDGKEVGLELKYPKAQSKDVRQLDGYLDEYRRAKEYSHKIRGILVAPKISPKVIEKLLEYGLQGKEVQFIEENSNEHTTLDQTETTVLDQTETTEQQFKENYETKQNDVEVNNDIKSDSNFMEIKNKLQNRYIQLRKDELSTDLILNTIKNEFPMFSLNEIKLILYL